MMSSEDRKRLLLSEFELIDTNHDLIFNKADLIRYLDEKNVRWFDAERFSVR